MSILRWILDRVLRRMDGMVLTCKELVELVTDYFEGALSPDLQARFEEHITTCAPCRAHLDQMRQTIEVVGSIPEDSLTPEVERDLLEAFRDWKTGHA